MTLTNINSPNFRATYNTEQIILAKKLAENYARSNNVGTKLLAETHAKKAAEQEISEQTNR